MRSCCLFTICKPSDDLSFHLVHRCNQMRAYASVAEHERHVFVGDVRVTTFRTHSSKGRAWRSFTNRLSQ
jgi:hypothetical protein